MPAEELPVHHSFLHLLSVDNEGLQFTSVDAFADTGYHLENGGGGSKHRGMKIERCD